MHPLFYLSLGYDGCCDVCGLFYYYSFLLWLLCQTILALREVLYYLRYLQYIYIYLFIYYMQHGLCL